MASTAPLMTKNPAVTWGSLRNSAAVAKVTARPIAACRMETARRFSLRIQAIASKAAMPNADCNSCMPHAPELPSAASHERHQVGHHGHEQHVGVERQARHVDHRLADVVGVHA